MLIKELSLAKTRVRTVPETVTLEDALELLEEFGYRCVPILDESGVFTVETSTVCIFISINQKERYDSSGDSFIKKCDKICAYFFFFL